MPRAQFTLRRMIVIVALVAVLLEGWIVWNRYAYSRERAATIARFAAMLRRRLVNSPAELARGTHLDFEDGNPAVPATPVNARRMIVRMDLLTARYERAARHPWLPFEANLPQSK